MEDYEKRYLELKDTWNRLEVAWQYQDFLSTRLASMGISLINYQSVKYQEVGENLSGYEIKLDTNYSKTGNLYFETSGKWHDKWVDRGLLKQDNTWLYLIGDYNKVFILSKVQLVAIYNNKNLYSKRGIKEVENDKGRSKGIIIPIKFLQEHNLILKEITFSL